MPLENICKENLLHFRRSEMRNMPNCILNYLSLISWSWRPLSFFKQLNMRAYIVSIAFRIVINTLLELLVQQSIKWFQRIKRLHFFKIFNANLFFGLLFNFFTTKMNLLILQNLSSIQYEKKENYQRFQLLDKLLRQI